MTVKQDEPALATRGRPAETAREPVPPAAGSVYRPEAVESMAEARQRCRPGVQHASPGDAMILSCFLHDDAPSSLALFECKARAEVWRFVSCLPHSDAPSD